MIKKVSVLFAGLLCVYSSVYSSAAVAASQDLRWTKDLQWAQDLQWKWHLQSTLTLMGNNDFNSPYIGASSFIPTTKSRETLDATLFLGLKPWQGGEIWVNPELEQGAGLSNGLGIAGYPSGEAYQMGYKKPYGRTQRLFLRQTYNLGGSTSDIEDGINQFAGKIAAQRIVLTLGKFAIPDIFDGSVSAHNPRGDFLNSAIAETGTFDYSADPWGYSNGIAGEYYYNDYTLRGGFFDMSKSSADPHLSGFKNFQTLVEFEKRYNLRGHNGAFRLTGFVSHAKMGKFSDAINAAQNGEIPDINSVTRFHNRAGIAFSADQNISDNLNLFARLGAADGKYESFEFTDIDRTFAIGSSLHGGAWARKNDVWGLAFLHNDISASHAQYLADGGIAQLIGDGRLTNKRPEAIIETYYSLAIAAPLSLSFDYQYVRNPAYNTARGPVSVFGLRVHTEY